MLHDRVRVLYADHSARFVGRTRFSVYSLSARFSEVFVFYLWIFRADLVAARDVLAAYFISSPAAEMTMMELPKMDIDTDPDMWPVLSSVLNVGVEGQTKLECPVDENPEIVLLPKKFSVGVEDMEVDIIEALDQQPAHVLRIVVPAENELADRTFTWKIQNWSEINQLVISSENFVIGGYEWRLLVPLFREDGCYADDLSLYLNAADSAELPFGWRRFASFSLAVVNQLDPKLTVKRRAMYHFHQDSTQFGFRSLLSMADLHNPDRGFLVNDSLIIETEVDVRKKMRKAATHLPNDCRKEKRFVGLKNQGATCYLNSLIQTLYHLPVFRKAVYHMPTSRNDLLSGSIPLALQRLFYKIQHSDTSPGTEDLTKSFGWDPSQCLREEDAHELNLFLREKLQDQMKGSPIVETIQQLFEGHVTNYMECIDVGYTSKRTDPFYDLQLDVKGCKDVYESLDMYIEVEKLEGDNQYSTEQFGLQNARKGAKFIDFPPVLQLQLKRFEYDVSQSAMVKTNDRYEFPLQLDLDRENGKYLSPDADRSVCNLYTLQSVVVHSGSSVQSGHYYAFIRPALSGQWYKFDDELVTKEELKTVLEENCGGEAEVQQRTADNAQFTSPPSKFTKHSNAYMLVYVRECDKEKVMCSIEEEDIPKHFQVRLKEEEPENKDIKNTNAHDYVLIRVSLEADLVKQIGKDIHFDLVNHDKVLKFRIKKQAIFKQLKAEVAKELRICLDRLEKFWLWSKRNNGTYRLARPLKEEEECSQVQEFNNGAEVLDLFLEVLPPGFDAGLQATTEATASQLFFFVKLYIPEAKQLMYLGKIFVEITEKPIDILESLNRMAGFVPDQEVQLYEEVAFHPLVMCDRIDNERAFEASGLENGDIICFQKTLTREEAERCRLPDVPSYFEYVHARQTVCSL